MAYPALSPFLLFGLVELLSRGVYSISILFILLHIGGEGMMKGEGASCLPNQSLALLQFKQSLSQESQLFFFSTWKNESDCCEWVGISCNHTTGFVTGLDISNRGLQVSDPNSFLFQLSHLRSLDLSSNSVTGLNLSRLSEITDLSEIRLSDCNLSGPILDFSKQLSNLTFLDVSDNDLSGEIPPSLLNHPTLQHLDLGGNNLYGSLPDFGNGSSLLKEVRLSRNMLDGEITPSIGNLPHLESLDLSMNQFTGTIHLSVFQNLRSLSFLDLSENELTAEMPKVDDLDHQAAIFSSLDTLRLRSCNIVGEFPLFLHSVKRLHIVDLSYNNISGKLPTWMWKKSNLLELDLSHNKLDGFEEAININGSAGKLDLPKFPLSLLMSNNNIKGAISAATFCNMFNLRSLQLSENGLTGTIPDCLTNLTRLQELDLRNNHLQGQIPRGLICGSLSVNVLALSDNQFTGEMTKLLANCSNTFMHVLDLSNNRLEGRIPKFTKFLQLGTLDLSNNQLQGPIPEDFNNFSTGSLTIFSLNDNKLVGRIPRSLSTCTDLEFIHLGNNELSDVFPFWLGHLDKLRVLVLRSNKLHGSISSLFSTHIFSSLLILDISGNQLKGHLPSNLFQDFSSMMTKQTNFDSLYMSYIGYSRYQEGLVLTVKGQSHVWKKIMILISIDLSNNLFTGGIPEDIGALKELISLNLSRNNLDGPIPRSFGQLQSMESLDLSHNNISGSIPEELTRDTFLSVLDLSCNNLQGRIPQGKQFGTFNASSFDGNPGLCGPPLPISCPSTESGPHGSINHVKEMAADPHWEYLAAGIGYAVGFLTTILPILFIQKVGSWFCVHVDTAFEACIRILTLSSIFCKVYILHSRNFCLL